MRRYSPGKANFVIRKAVHALAFLGDRTVVLLTFEGDEPTVERPDEFVDYSALRWDPDAPIGTSGARFIKHN